jgi:hypothetical protein
VRGWYEDKVINIKRIAAATAIASGLGLAGVGAASVAEAMPMAPLPDYHWCPGQWFDPAWGNNWDGGRCHDDGFFDGEPRDGGHWHGNGPWNGGGGGWDNHGPNGWDNHGNNGGDNHGPNGWDNHGPGGHDGWHN